MALPEGILPGQKVNPADLSLPGDVRVGTGVYRAGDKVAWRSPYFSNDFGLAAYQDEVERPDGSRGLQDFGVFDQGAVLVYPTFHRRGQSPREATVLLGTGMKNYGSGETDAMEAIGSRIRTKGNEQRTGDQAALELLESRGLEVSGVVHMATLLDLTGRVYNPTEHVLARLTKLPDSDALTDKRIRPVRLGEVPQLINTGELVNSTIVAGLSMVRDRIESQ